MSSRVLSRGGLAAALAGAMALGGCGGAASAASIATVDLDGLQAWLRQQRGHPVLVNFWATWCVPCVGELPDLVRGTRDFRKAGGVVVGVAMECVVDGVNAAPPADR